MAHRVAPLAEADLDDIWLYVARESGSLETANRLIDRLTDRFLLLASFPISDVPAMKISAPDAAASLWANMSSFIVLKTRTRLSCVWCMADATWTLFSATENPGSEFMRQTGLVLYVSPKVPVPSDPKKPCFHSGTSLDCSGAGPRRNLQVMMLAYTHNSQTRCISIFGGA